MPKTLHFKSGEAYRKWSAYGHMHEKFKQHLCGNYPNVDIAGHHHKVFHEHCVGGKGKKEPHIGHHLRRMP